MSFVLGSNTILTYFEHDIFSKRMQPSSPMRISGGNIPWDTANSTGIKKSKYQKQRKNYCHKALSFVLGSNTLLTYFEHDIFLKRLQPSSPMRMSGANLGIQLTAQALKKANIRNKEKIIATKLCPLSLVLIPFWRTLNMISFWKGCSHQIQCAYLEVTSHGIQLTAQALKKANIRNKEKIVTAKALSFVLGSNTLLTYFELDIFLKRLQPSSPMRISGGNLGIQLTA